MTKSIYILLSLLISGNIFCQNSIISESDIPELDSIINYLEVNYSQSETPNFYSLPQALATYFEIITKEPKNFLSELKKSENIKQLQNKFKGLQVDKDLLIIKNAYLNYKKEKKLQIKSFEIGKSQRHIIDSQNYEIEIFSNKKQNSRIYFSSYQEKWSKHKESTIIKGFYLNQEFKSVAIPKKLSDWINYTDLIVKPETSIFYDNDDKSNEFKPYQRTIIDSLVNYYELKTEKPPYRKEQDYITRRYELNEWQSKKEKFADSFIPMIVILKTFY
ncbi:hypothetical protein [Tenacibaculum sp. SG-28]|uniref:hypothetical protein n=1 Tax=Tenacibaculum sp. SG-28 TaxID=754426 RepID=UPI000CF41754|nr:hypothetical protein [Tenacibaculum sp. SG-28]PQJ20598.1 hypothetical protein BSU00_09805 [Tenacibaculum sp. SG-28]